MYMPGWRAVPPEELSKGISGVLRGGGRTSTKVAERYVADTERGIALPFTVPIVAWGMLRTLSFDERVVWIAWAVALSILARVQRMRRRTPGDG
jgi:hypothetical protein